MLADTSVDSTLHPFNPDNPSPFQPYPRPFSSPTARTPSGWRVWGFGFHEPRQRQTTRSKAEIFDLWSTPTPARGPYCFEFTQAANRDRTAAQPTLRALPPGSSLVSLSKPHKPSRHGVKLEDPGPLKGKNSANVGCLRLLGYLEAQCEAEKWQAERADAEASP